MTEAPPLHVLVIEDDHDVLELLEGHLRRLGCRVSLAETGEDGLDIAATDPPDMVIVDILLPGVDGREVTRRLREDPRTSDCKIIVSSVLDTDDLDGVASDAVLPKPFRRASVTEVVETLAARRRPQGD